MGLGNPRKTEIQGQSSGLGLFKGWCKVYVDMGVSEN